MDISLYNLYYFNDEDKVLHLFFEELFGHQLPISLKLKNRIVQEKIEKENFMFLKEEDNIIFNSYEKEIIEKINSEKENINNLFEIYENSRIKNVIKLKTKDENTFVLEEGGKILFYEVDKERTYLKTSMVVNDGNKMSFMNSRQKIKFEPEKIGSMRIKLLLDN